MNGPVWTSPADWQTPAGRMLQKLSAVLPRDREFVITVFGSAPLQIMVDASLLSGDIDVFSDNEDLEHWVRAAGLGREQTEFHIQVCSGLNFRTSPNWGTRTQSVKLVNCTFVFPHPIDILIAKLNRLDEKDLEAFQEIIAPALAKRRAGYDLPARDYKRELKEAALAYR